MKYEVDVPVRWSDMDSYGHVNHARTVSLLEEARIELLFGEMARRGMGHLAGGIVVSALSVNYLAPVTFDDGPVRVEMWVTDVKAAYFVLRYKLRGRDGSRVAATAQTTLVPYDLAGARPRRLTDNERDFLALWTAADPVAEGVPSA